MTDVQTLARLMLSSRIRHGQGVTYGSRSLTSTVGLSRAEMHLRMRRCHRVEWTWDRLCAAVAELTALGGMRLSAGCRGGYVVADWSVIERAAQAVAA